MNTVEEVQSTRKMFGSHHTLIARFHICNLKAKKHETLANTNIFYKNKPVTSIDLNHLVATRRVGRFSEDMVYVLEIEKWSILLNKAATFCSEAVPKLGHQFLSFCTLTIEVFNLLWIIILVLTSQNCETKYFTDVYAQCF